MVVEEKGVGKMKGFRPNRKDTREEKRDKHSAKMGKPRQLGNLIFDWNGEEKQSTESGLVHVGSYFRAALSSSHDWPFNSNL